MSEASAARGANWPGFSVAALVLVFLSIAALLGDMLAGGRTSVPMVVMAAGYVTVAAFVERKRRNMGVLMLVASPIVYIGALTVIGALRGL